MTISQMKAFIRAAAKKQAIKQMQFISGVAIGAQSDGKHIKKAMADLEKLVAEVNKGN